MDWEREATIAATRYGGGHRDEGIIPLMQDGSKKEDKGVEMGCEEKGGKKEARKGGKVLLDGQHREDPILVIHSDGEGLDTEGLHNAEYA